MEMAVANVSNIMERVISLSSFQKSILVKYLCCLARYVSFGSNGMQNEGADLDTSEVGTSPPPELDTSGPVSYTHLTLPTKRIV